MFRLKKMNKKGQKLSSDGILNKIIGVVIAASVIAGTASLVLDSFTNMTTVGLALGVLFATVLPLLFAVFVFRVFQRQF